MPKGIVAALTFDGEIKLFEAAGPEAAKGIKAALQGQDGEFSRIASGPNRENLTVNELYSHFEERWAGEVPEAFKKNWKDKKEDGDDKDSDDKKPDFLKKKDK